LPLKAALNLLTASNVAPRQSSVGQTICSPERIRAIPFVTPLHRTERDLVRLRYLTPATSPSADRLLHQSRKANGLAALLSLTRLVPRVEQNERANVRGHSRRGELQFCFTHKTNRVSDNATLPHR
jgi:hypothetical protein